MKHKQRKQQQGQGLVQCMVGMSLSLLVVMAAFSAFAWIQRGQLMLQTQAETQLRLHTALQLFRERVQRAGAPELSVDAQGMAVLSRLPVTLSGSDTTLQLNQWRSLTPADCQGHEASTLPWLQDDFRRNSQRELSCKDTARSNTTYQALAEQIDDLRLRYAEQTGPAGATPAAQQLQWRSAAQVSDWQQVRAVGLCIGAVHALQCVAAGLLAQHRFVARLESQQCRALAIAASGLIRHLQGGDSHFFTRSASE